jgi:hypothetical protein
MATAPRERATSITGKEKLKEGVLMIDLNPYFQRKLGETLEFVDEDRYDCTYLLEVIAVNDRPNAVYFEVSYRSRSVTGHHQSIDYHGVVEVDLNQLQSVRSVLKTALAKII